MGERYLEKEDNMGRADKSSNHAAGAQPVRTKTREWERKTKMKIKGILAIVIYIYGFFYFY